ncbi:hypothetical protein CDAR_86981 [Caerostris darwini]|uniref:Uncharacterized protein n=1 Tax=Caerostris darwini TaxID=1538125 RepID=A0AAV4U804_9ARAC|nr:hypothetical protein CDAR_86981 [Caerostris darwini]
MFLQRVGHFFKSEEGLKCRGTLRICSQDLLQSYQKSGLSPTQDKPNRSWEKAEFKLHTTLDGYEFK